VLLDLGLALVAGTITGHGLGDEAYWGTAPPWLANAIAWAGVIATAIAVLLIAPVVLLTRAMRRWPPSNDADRECRDERHSGN
jgi:hypothetical protein